MLEGQNVDDGGTSGHDSNIRKLRADPFNRARRNAKYSTAIASRHFEFVEDELTARVNQLDLAEVVTAEDFVRNEMLVFLRNGTAGAYEGAHVFHARGSIKVK